MSENLIDKCEMVFHDNEIIFCEYELGKEFYFIKSGKVRLTKIVNKKEVIIDILQHGMFFGEMAVIESAPRSASATASGTVHILKFSQNNFESVFLENKELAVRLIKALVNRINIQKKRLHIFMYKEPIGRVIACLFNLRVILSRKNEKVSVVKSSVDDIAKWVRLSDKECKKVIDYLSQQGLIAVQNNCITFLDEVDMKRQLILYSKQK